MHNSNLGQWVPYKMMFDADPPYCRWLYVGEKKFSEPFFEETILNCLSLPYNSKKQKSASQLTMMETWATQVECVPPKAIVFHISRCGSTLVSQLLSLLPQNIVLSEVPFLDEVLRLPYQHRNISIDKSDALFKACLSFYGQQRNTVQENLFIKTDSWHLLFYERLRRLFPDVPFVLLYRHPEEVMRSQQRKKGMHAVPGLIEPELFSFDREMLNLENADAYFATVLETYLATYLQIFRNDKNVVLLNYKEGMLNIMNKIADITNLLLSDTEWDTMHERVKFHSKYPDRKFTEDQHPSLNPELMWRCNELYQQLDRCRKGE